MIPSDDLRLVMQTDEFPWHIDRLVGNQWAAECPIVVDSSHGQILQSYCDPAIFVIVEEVLVDTDGIVSLAWIRCVRSICEIQYREGIPCLHRSCSRECSGDYYAAVGYRLSAARRPFA